MKKGIVTIVVLFLILGIAPTSFAQRPLTIRLGVHGAVQGAPDVIAIRQGYFKQERLEVDWRRFGVGREGRDAMIAGAIDINATATTPFLIGLEKGVPYTAVAVNSYFCGTNHIVVRKESDIQSIAQLKGKRIALARGTLAGRRSPLCASMETQRAVTSAVGGSSNAPWSEKGILFK